MPAYNTKKFLCCISAFCVAVFALGQNTITGKVINSAQGAISNANVLLLNSKDSSLVKGAISNTNGNFAFQNIANGQYLLSCSFVGFESLYLPLTSIDTKTTYLDLGVIRLQAETGKLATATVTGRKPLFEQKIDRMVVNVKNSITSAGGTVLDVLQKSPGVIVNKQAGTINMNGKDGVMVMINGKLSYMPSDAIIQMLNGMSASNVEKIELITTPPARYDASGNAGYINIVLASSPDAGFNGSVAISAGAFVGNTQSLNVNFNYRVKKVNLYGSYSFLREEKITTRFITNYRKVVYQGKITEMDAQSNRDPIQLNHNARVGLDYQASGKTTFGFLASAYDNKWTMDARNSTYISVNGRPDSIVRINNDEVNQWKNWMLNGNVHHAFGKGLELNLNADYLYYDDNNPNNYLNRYFNATDQLSRNENTRSTKKTIINIFPFQADLKKKFGEKADMEAGGKLVFSHFTNDVGVAKQYQGVWIPDNNFTAKYTLQEDIAALYASFNITLNDKNAFKGGLRYEFTNSNLGSEQRKNIVDRKYGNLFPTLYLSHKINDSNSVNLGYNRRINRPAFTDLAPFTIFLDPYTFITGNSALQPSILDALKMNYVLQKLVFSIGYSYEANTIGFFQSEVDLVANKEFITARNLEGTHTVNLSVSLPWTITKWWNSQVNLNGNWQKIKADYKQKPLTITNYNYNISGSQNFILPKDYAIELSGFYQSSGFFGTVASKAFGQLNGGIQKKWNASLIRFGVDDIFSTMAFRSNFSVPDEDFYIRGLFRIGQRIFKLTYTHNFGNKVLKDKRQRGTASEEERQRVK